MRPELGLALTAYAWGGWKVNRFEMRILPNTRVFVGPYTPTTQVLDLLGERWQMGFVLVPGVDNVQGAAQEAFWDRLGGPANQITIWNLKRPVPLGTLRDGIAASVVNGALAAVSVVNGALAPVTVIEGTPTNMASIAQLANATSLQTVAGRTLRAGDHIGLSNGQNVRIMADTTASGAGVMVIEFQPRARTAMLAYGAITWNKPTLNVMLKADGVPTVWSPGMFEGTSVELIESL